MGFYHYDGGVVADQATGRPLMGQPVKIFDEETDAPIQAYREGQPVTLVTGAHGLIEQFQTEDTTRRVRMEVGPVRLRQWSQEMIASAAAAGDDISSALEQVEVVRAEAAAIVPRMEQIEAMAGLAPGEVTDAQTANLITRQDTETRNALNAAISEASRGPSYYAATNLVPVPDYAAFPNGWKYLGSGSGVVAGNNLTVTGLGDISGVGVYTDRALMSIPAGHKVYVRAVISTPTQSASYSVSLSNGTEHVYVNGTAASVRNPTPNTPVAVSGILTIPSTWTAGGVSLFQVAYQSNAAAANGVKATFAPPVVIDLTEVYGAGEEPDKAHVDALVEALPQPVRTVPEFDKFLPKPQSTDAG